MPSSGTRSSSLGTGSQEWTEVGTIPGAETSARVCWRGKSWLCSHGASTPSTRESESRSVVSDSLRPHGLYSPGQDTGVGSLSLVQEIFPTQGSNPGLPHCRWILYQLSLKGSLNEEMKHWKNHRFISIITKSVIDSDKNNQ